MAGTWPHGRAAGQHHRRRKRLSQSGRRREHNRNQSPARQRKADDEGKEAIARLAARKIEAQLGANETSAANSLPSDARAKATHEARATLDDLRRNLDPTTI